MKRLPHLILVLLVLALVLLGLWEVFKPPFKCFIMKNGAISILKYNGSDKVVTIPSVINGRTVTAIGALRNFSFSTSPTNIVMPASVTNISDYNPFYEDTSLIAITVDANNPAFSSVAGVLFNKNQTTLIYCPAGMVGSYGIPNGVTSIAKWAFNNARLTSVTIPDGVTNIGEGAFWVCTNLTHITIPKSVIHIGTFAFAGSTGLKEIYFQGNAPDIKDAWGLEQPVLGGSETTIHYLPGTTGWSAMFSGRPTALWKQ